MDHATWQEKSIQLHESPLTVLHGCMRTVATAVLPEFRCWNYCSIWRKLAISVIPKVHCRGWRQEDKNRWQHLLDVINLLFFKFGYIYIDDLEKTSGWTGSIQRTWFTLGQWFWCAIWQPLSWFVEMVKVIMYYKLAATFQSSRFITWRAEPPLYPRSLD